MSIASRRGRRSNARTPTEIDFPCPRLPDMDNYWRWLLVPWKLATAGIATMVLVAAGPLSGDPDWDPFLALLMSALTFASAPWVVGTVWRRRQLFAAAVFWLASTMAVFEVYWFARRGVWPEAPLANLAASTVLYAAGGLLWNLEWRFDQGIVFAFRQRAWPRVRAQPSFWRLALPV